MAPGAVLAVFGISISNIMMFGLVIWAGVLGQTPPSVQRWFSALLSELDQPRDLFAGWFAASAAGALFVSTDGELTYRYIEVGLES